jgi:epoxyqueuosine reductase
MSLHPTIKNLTDEILTQARVLGFELVGTTPRLKPLHFDAFERWLEAGMFGEMTHLRENAARRKDLRTLFNDARSIIVVAANYSALRIPEEIRRDPSRGIIASYAGGEDYHPWMLSHLEKLAEKISKSAPGSRFRAYADMGPVMERDFAAQVGLGFIGKNALLIHPQRGSFFVLGVLITNLDIPEHANPIEVSCGNCTRCLDACPTQALVAPHILDARRCITYLTVELKSAIPHEMRPLIGNRIFGCDECQLVCPWNEKFARLTAISEFQTTQERRAPKLASLVPMNDRKFEEHYAGTALLRRKRRSFLRNVSVALGNWGSEDTLEPLLILIEDEEPLIRAHAAWALGRLGKVGRNVLKTRKWIESDGEVLKEIEEALTGK